MSRQSKLELDALLHSEAVESMTEQGELRGVLSALIDSIDDPVFSVDASLRYTSFNAAHAADMKVLYGADIELGLSFLDYQTVPEDRQPGSGQPRQGFAWRAPRHGGVRGG